MLASLDSREHKSRTRYHPVGGICISDHTPFLAGCTCTEHCTQYCCVVIEIKDRARRDRQKINRGLHQERGEGVAPQAATTGRTMTGPTAPLEGDTDNDGSPRWCAQECCKRRPFYGKPGGAPLYCAQHSRKSEGMVDVSSRRCEAVGCAKWPLYGHEVSSGLEG